MPATLQPGPGAAAVAVAMYGLCSTVLLLMNRVVLNFTPLAGYQNLMQLVVTIPIALAIRAFSNEQNDGITLDQLRLIALYAGGFGVSMLFTIKFTECSTGETVLAFRAAVPLLTALLEWRLTRRALPDPPSLLALLGVLLGTVGYVAADFGLSLEEWYTWVWAVAYTAAVCAQMCIAKYVVCAGPLSVAGLVLCVSVLEIPVLFALGMSLTWEHLFLEHTITGTTPVGDVMLIVSGVVAAAVSFSAWRCRRVVSAASFALLGVMSKLVLAVASMALVAEHPSRQGLAFLGLGVLSAALYRQPLALRDAADPWLLGGTVREHKLQAGPERTL